MEHAKQQTAQDRDCRLLNMGSTWWIGGRDGERKDRNTSSSHMSKLAKHTSIQRVTRSSPLSSLICPCHTYKELVQQIHELPLTSSLCSVCLLVQASCRCTCCLWSWSSSFKCLWHLTGLYHRKAWRRGQDSVHHQRMWIVLQWVSLSEHPPPSLLYRLCCVLLEGPCVQDVYVIAVCLCVWENKTVLSQQQGLTCHDLFFFLPPQNSGSQRKKTVSR